MRIFVAGASGALGSRLVPQLIDAGHDVTRHPQLAGERRAAADARREAGDG
jgi:nucleoside-diphosphate-sugar epimerase